MDGDFVGPSGLTSEEDEERQIRLSDAKAKIELSKQKKISDIEIGETQKKEEIKLLEKRRSDAKEGYSEQAKEARRMVRLSSNLKSALDDLKTGRMAAARQKLGSIIPGIRDANAEDFLSLTNEFVLGRKDELLGGGILSDADIELLFTTGPQLGTSIEGNLRIIERIEAASKEKLNEVKSFTDFLKDGGDPADFQFEKTESFFADLEPGQPAQRLTGEESLDDLLKMADEL